MAASCKPLGGLRGFVLQRRAPFGESGMQGRSWRGQVGSQTIPLPNRFGINIAAARAVDREFNYNFGSDLGAGEAAGLRPPAPPCFPGGSAPRTPKRRSAPLAAAVVRSLATKTLVGGSFCSRNPTFLKKPLVPGNFAAWGRTFLKN